MPEDQLPEGWGALEFAEHRARLALANWDEPSQKNRLARGMALAATMRRLLAEIEADRRARRG